MTMTHQQADACLNDALRDQQAYLWLHTGDPGAAGTANVAQSDESNIVRKAIAFNAPENHPTNTERRCLSDGEVTWSGIEIDPGEEITHFSIWNSETVGIPVFMASVTDSPRIVGSDGVVVEDEAVECAIQVHVKPT